MKLLKTIKCKGINRMGFLQRCVESQILEDVIDCFGRSYIPARKKYHEQRSGIRK